MNTGGGGRTANSPPKASALNRRSLEPASAEGMVKTQVKARSSMISVNFFHIRSPSFRMVLFVFYFFRRRVKKIYSMRIWGGRPGAGRKNKIMDRIVFWGAWLERGGERIDDDAFSMPRSSD